jgi:hypothetical protein
VDFAAKKEGNLGLYKWAEIETVMIRPCVIIDNGRRKYLS